MKEDKLIKLFELLDSKKILFVGIGNALKSDDAIGIYICKKIQQSNKIETLIVESGIEKFVGKINSIDPEILILVDCTDFNKEPGFIKLLPIEQIQDFTVNTHTISVKRISEFFKMKTFILGVQPENVRFGEEFSKGVINSANELIKKINA